MSFSQETQKGDLGGTIDYTEQIRKSNKMNKSINLSESYKELDEIQKIIRENEDEIKKIYD